uniref:Mab-21-like HhH/H2TH-like domain-containing protein n=1 Tax=Ficedula albicollis TaxID=59894 RepID=A0A803WF75_FICAL
NSYSTAQAMFATTLLLLLVQGLIQYPQQAGDGLDEAARERMQQRAEYLDQQMVQLIQELEQKNLEHTAVAWGALLMWQLWAVTGILILLLALWFGLHKIRHDPDNNGHKERSSSNLEEINNDGKGEEVNAAGNEKDKHDANEEDHNVQRNLGNLLEERIQLPVLDLDKGCYIIMDLMDKLKHIFAQGLSNSFYPVPQQAIGVGSAFEGWSPHAQDLVYHVLVPLSAPPGHAFHLELDAAGVLQRNCRVRVELLCTCTREQLGQDMLCFLHHSEEELREQDPSLLHTLCTGTYLDVEKTVYWFCQFVTAAWLLLPQSRHWRLMLQPSSRSCIFHRDQECFLVEVIFGVQQGDTDIFVGSQPTQVGIPSTTWLETCAVAEAKFFRHIARQAPRDSWHCKCLQRSEASTTWQAPRDSWHCKCLQLLSHILTGVGFSSYALKTVVMHLLSTVPLTQWCRQDFRRRMMDTLKYLRCSLDTKQLNHFVIGNKRFPVEISLPSDFRVAEAPNLFQHLASDPDAHIKAMQEYIHLLDQLKQMLF